MNFEEKSYSPEKHLALSIYLRHVYGIEPATITPSHKIYRIFLSRMRGDTYNKIARQFNVSNSWIIFLIKKHGRKINSHTYRNPIQIIYMYDCL